MQNGLSKKSCSGPTYCLLVLLSSLLAACGGANRAPEAGGPKALSVPYPVKLMPSAERTSEVVAAWTAIASQQGFSAAPLPAFNPTTGTITALPPLPEGGLRLPVVGGGGPMTEDDAREALKRFINAVQPILGTERTQLSLINTDTAASGTKVALYEQRPFRYQIRNGFGRVRIVYDSSRRVTDLNSTVLPDLQTVFRDLNEVRASVRPEQVIAALGGKTVSWTDSSGVHQVFISAEHPPQIGDLVLFPIKNPSNADEIDLHLAWEIKIPDSSSPEIYVDAVTQTVLGGSV